jgi:hypothetical protein
MRADTKYLLLFASFCLAYKNRYLVDHAYTISSSNNTNNYIEYLISYTYPDTSIPFNQSLIAGIRPYSIAFLDNNKD